MKFKLCSQFAFCLQWERESCLPESQIQKAVCELKSGDRLLRKWKWNSFICRQVPRCLVIKVYGGWHDGQVIKFSLPWTWWPVSQLIRLWDLHLVWLFTCSALKEMVWLFRCCGLWRDLIWVTLNYWDAGGGMVNSGVLLLTQWRLLGALRKSWLFKLWRLQGDIRSAWLNLWAHEVPLMCSRINLVKEVMRMETISGVAKPCFMGIYWLFALRGTNSLQFSVNMAKFPANLPVLYDSWEGKITESQEEE